MRANWWLWEKDLDVELCDKFVNICCRKLSIVIQLSDPKDYDGGDFEFFDEGGNGKFRGKGSVLVFPSVHMHRVTEVTSGVRYSLVSWAEGLRWR